MIVEYSQLLSTAHRVLDGTKSVVLSSSGRKRQVFSLDSELDTILYSATHANHPSAIWVRKSTANYIWLSNMLMALCKEYTYRYGKVHKVERDGLCQVLLDNVPKNIPVDVFTQPTPAMPEECIVPGDSIASYHRYYIMKKLSIAKWKGKTNSREVPKWFPIKLVYYGVKYDDILSVNPDLAAFCFGLYLANR